MSPLYHTWVHETVISFANTSSGSAGKELVHPNSLLMSIWRTLNDEATFGCKKYPVKIYNKHTHCKSPAENCISWHQFALHKFVQHSGYDEIKEERNWSLYPIKTSMIFIKSAVYLCSILVFTVYSFGSVPSYMTCEWRSLPGLPVSADTGRPFLWKA